MEALAHILFLLISSTWAGPRSQACIEGLLLEAYASAPLSVATAEADKEHFVLRIDRNAQIVLTHGRKTASPEALALPPFPYTFPGEHPVSIRTLEGGDDVVGVFAYTNLQRVFRIGLTPVSKGTPYIGNWKLIAEGVSPLFQPIANETLVEIDRESGAIVVNYRGDLTWIGELKIVPQSFVAFADPSTPNPISLGHNLTLWIVGTPKQSNGRSPERHLYSWSQAKNASAGRLRMLHPNSIQAREFPLAISAQGAGRRDGVVLKSVLTKGQGEKREISYRLHRYFHGQWTYLGSPDATPVRPVRPSSASFLRGAAAVRKLEQALAKVGIHEPEAVDVARITLKAEDVGNEEGAFPALFVGDFDLLAETFAMPASTLLESLEAVDDLWADPRPHGPRDRHPEAWRQWVASLVLQGMLHSCPSDDDVYTIRRRLHDELGTLPGLAHAPFWELVNLALEKMRAEQDYNGSL